MLPHMPVMPSASDRDRFALTCTFMPAYPLPKLCSVTTTPAVCVSVAALPELLVVTVHAPPHAVALSPLTNGAEQSSASDRWQPGGSTTSSGPDTVARTVIEPLRMGSPMATPALALADPSRVCSAWTMTEDVLASQNRPMP